MNAGVLHEGSTRVAARARRRLSAAACVLMLPLGALPTSAFAEDRGSVTRVYINSSGSLRIVLNNALSFIVRYDDPRLSRIESLVLAGLLSKRTLVVEPAAGTFQSSTLIDWVGLE